MHIKDDWLRTDTLTINDYNTIIDRALTIKDKLQRIQRRRLRNRDLLYVGTKLHLSFPDNLKSILESELAVTHTLTFIEFGDHSITASYDPDTDEAKIYIDNENNVLYRFYVENEQIHIVNLSEYILDVAGIVTIVDGTEGFVANQYIEIIDEEPIYAVNGYFLLANSTDALEKILRNISIMTSQYFEYKQWYTYVHISYKDVNRWSVFLNYIYDIITESKYIKTEDNIQLLTESSEKLITEREEI